jgi:phage shock protein A
MSYLSRIGQLIRGNVNAALNGLEDPQKMLDVVMEDMRAEVAKTRKRVAAALTEQKLIKMQIEDHEKNSALWAKRAEAAVVSDEDELAQEALIEKSKSARAAAELQPRWELLVTETDSLKEDLKEMDIRVKETEEKKNALVTSAKIAEARAASAKLIAAPLGESEHLDAFSRAEEKIKKMEAASLASRELTTEQISNDPRIKFAKFDRKVAQLDAQGELEKLREKLGKQRNPSVSITKDQQ